MSKPVSKRELLEMQIKTYEFYAGLIDRAIGGSRANTMPKWDEQRALEYRQLADGLREQCTGRLETGYLLCMSPFYEAVDAPNAPFIGLIVPGGSYLLDIYAKVGTQTL
jgi:hypothetical protein